jgi:thiamine biosynthesis lipoprotein
VNVSQEMIEVLLIAKDAYALTQGALDVSQGALYEFWKDIIKKGGLEALPAQDKISSLQSRAGIEYIIVDPHNQTVTIRKKGLKIDLGALAKGYMIDKAVQQLKRAGVRSVLINAGGDMYCLGLNKSRHWKVGLRNPYKKHQFVTTFELTNEALATSGDYEQFFKINEQRYSHLINPFTGYPVRNSIVSVSVVGGNCVSADAFATAFYILGTKGIEEFLARVPSTMKVYVMGRK